MKPPVVAVLMTTGFYVTAIDGPRVYPMVGPFSDHETALAYVDIARITADQHDPRAWFMAWGTSRYRLTDPPRKGSMNALLGVSPCPDHPHC